MDIRTFLLIGVLSSVAANLIHWHGRKDERFIYLPRTRFLRSLFFGWTIAMLAAAGSYLAGALSAPVFLGVALGLTIAQALYSIARRETQRSRP